MSARKPESFEEGTTCTCSSNDLEYSLADSVCEILLRILIAGNRRENNQFSPGLVISLPGLSKMSAVQN